jgi:hypothetical protein
MPHLQDRPIETGRLHVTVQVLYCRSITPATSEFVR